jgi:hypothetical protein
VGADAEERDAARVQDAPWWTKPSRRLPILLAILAGVAAYGIPRIGQDAARGTARTCSARVRSEPRNHSGDRTYVVRDAFGTGTWAETDPCNGTWYPPDRTPPNARRRLPNGYLVTVDCARVAAPYAVRFTSGGSATWTTWLHTRGGLWIPNVGMWQVPHDGLAGLPAC